MTVESEDGEFMDILEDDLICPVADLCKLPKHPFLCKVPDCKELCSEYLTHTKHLAHI